LWLLDVRPKSFFVTSLRGSGSVPTILAKVPEAALVHKNRYSFALGVVSLPFFSPSIGRKRD